MPLNVVHAVSVTNLISVAVAPVVLISAAAILLSGYSNKYGNIADRLRALATEYRRPETTPLRRDVIRGQLILFHRRIAAVWATSALLTLSLVAFVGTVLSVIFAQGRSKLGIAGADCLVIGVVLVGAAVLTDLYEIHLARLTIAGELSDILQDKLPGESCS
jgi:hypothetical protein